MLPIDYATISAVLFDAGGTLVHVDYEVFVGVARARGFDLDERELRVAEARGRQVIDRQWRESGGVMGADASRVGNYFRAFLENSAIPDAIASEIAEEVRSQHRAENIWRIPMPGAVETLSELRSRGVRTAVVSNADGRAEAGLRSAGIADHVEFVVDSHYEGVEKPDPEIFHRALRRLDVPARSAVYIGDIYSIDAVGSRAAGLSPVIIDPTGTYTGLDCPVISSLRELIESAGQEEST